MLRSAAQRVPRTAIAPSLVERRLHHQSTRIHSRSAVKPPEHPLYSYGPSNIFRESAIRTWVSRTGCAGARSLHSTRRNEALPVVVLAALKASTALETARTISRVALTIAPVLLFKNMKSRKILKYSDKLQEPDMQEKRDVILKRIRYRTLLFHGLILTPVLLFWAAIMASLERTPLTGRWRVILLAPEEEEEIAKQLAGPGWTSAVTDIIAEDGPPNVIPTTDWRYAWVTQILRRLEQAIPTVQKEQQMAPLWLHQTPDGVPLPPPAEHPLRPRPRASERLRSFVDWLCDKRVHAIPHAIPGPPYALMLVDKPDASNAFSYGFGPDGAGGVVVYSGFLDEVLSKASTSALPQVPPEPQSWWSQLFGAFTSPRPVVSGPSEEQSAQLAILLAHELSHLVLAHHLESLSSASVVVPGVLSIVTDVVRTVLFPLTMMFGPFVNDAVAQIGKVGTLDFNKAAQKCVNVKQEIEADVVSARLLAYAGYDARQAIKFWENRRECASADSEEEESTSKFPLARWGHSSSHPVSDVRVAKLKEELERWDTEREKALKSQAEK